MSFVASEPNVLSSTAGNLASVGEQFTAGPTTGLGAPASDLVSAITVTRFSAHGELYQAMCQRGAAIHPMFVNTCHTNAGVCTAEQRVA
jgi:hypothetical protein